MGLFDDLFGGKNTTTSNQATNTSSATTGQQTQANQTQTAQQTSQTQQQNTTSQTQSGTKQQQATTGSNVVSSLDADTINLLKGILTPAASGAAGAVGDNSNANALKEIADNLNAKATGGNLADVNKAVEASTAKARLDFSTGEGAQVNQIAQQIGSSKNTYSELIKNKGLADLNTQIAQIAASGALQADQLNTADFNSAADAIVKASQVAGNDATAALNPVLQIVSLLKGANTSSTSAENTTGQSDTSSQTSEQQLANVLSQVAGQQSGTSNTNQSGTLSSVSNTTGNEQTKTSKGIIGDILSIF